MTTAQENDIEVKFAPLTPAAADLQRPPEPAPTEYSVDFLVETADGFHALIRGEHLRPSDMMAWLKRTSSALVGAGFKPVSRALAVDVDVEAPGPGSPAAPPAGEATWIKGENGAPPRCSVHGLGKYVEGAHKPTNADGTPNPKAGQRYAFWGCNTRGCRPRGEPA